MTPSMSIIIRLEVLENQHPGLFIENQQTVVRHDCAPVGQRILCISVLFGRCSTRSRETTGAPALVTTGGGARALAAKRRATATRLEADRPRYLSSRNR